MKKCPHCGEDFGFSRFLARCGSDTLVSHPLSLFHRSEHRCFHCHQLFWIEHHPGRTRQTVRASVNYFLGAGVLYFLLAKFFFNWEFPKTAGIGAILLFAGYPVYWSFIKYVSSELKPD